MIENHFSPVVLSTPPPLFFISPMQANVAFCAKLVKSFAPIPMMGPNVVVLLGSGASMNNLKRAKQSIKGAAIVGSIKDGIPVLLEDEARKI